MLPSSYITDNLASATISAIHDAKPSLKEVDEGIFAKVRGSTEMQAHTYGWMAFQSVTFHPLPHHVKMLTRYYISLSPFATYYTCLPCHQYEKFCHRL